MLNFLVYNRGELASEFDLAGAYLSGSDGVPVRAEIVFAEGMIRCKKRYEGACALSVMWSVEGFGRVLLSTTRLPDREEPYVLNVELARSRLMLINQKREDWGLIDYPGAEPLSERADQALGLFIKALQKLEYPAEAAKLADESLRLAMGVGEDLSQFHANIFLERRRATGNIARAAFGCTLQEAEITDVHLPWLREAFDIVTVPVNWKQIEPKEQELDFSALDRCINQLASKRLAIRCATLVDFSEQATPDWLFIWEHDFETVRDLVYDHIQRVVRRYGPYVNQWQVISGVHADNALHFNFEQLMELTRLAAATTKRLAPRSATIVDLRWPWGEYYARNQRTIPPMLYAEMTVQSGINFDAFGLQLHFGLARDGMYVRDLMQVSALLDRFGALGKPLHITAVRVPSRHPTDGGGLAGGIWHGPWDQFTQAKWLQQFYMIALSKPFVESVSWYGLADRINDELPYCGLLSEQHKPKSAYHQLAELKNRLIPGAQVIVDQQRKNFLRRSNRAND